MRIAAGVEYCGAGYHGWQSQSEQGNIQDCVQEALSVVADRPVKVHCAGRTDTGVHALEQVIHFDPGVRRRRHAWVLGANVNLPPDIRVLWAVPVSEDFHARFSATEREYHYFILNRVAAPAVQQRRMTWECRPLDEQRMLTAARGLVGEHDFTSFRALGCQAASPVREVRELTVERRAEVIRIRITANAFLHHMVRNIAGVLMAIGMGRREPDWAVRLLADRDRTAGGVTAPADGLYLARVGYPGGFGLPRRPGTAYPWWN